MKRFLVLVIAALALVVVQINAQTTVYFSDTFDRANSTDLNASSHGKSGTLGALDWSVNNIPGTATVDINGYALRIKESTSSGGAIVWPDHNFTEPTGEFWVSTVIGYTASGGNGRTAGFGIGQTLADLTGATFGYPTSAGSPPADVYISYDNIGPTAADKNIYIVTNRSVAATIPLVASLPDTLSAHFTFDSMTAGSALNYEVFLDGVSIYSGSTVWSGTDENYISVMANTTLDTKFSRFIVADDVVLFSDDADNTASGVAPSAGVYAEYRYANMATVRDEGTATPFGPNNQYIEVKDDDINAGVMFMSQEFPETRAALSTFSFDFYEPSTGGTVSGMVVGYSRYVYNLATAYARIRLSLRNGAVGLLATGSATYDLDTAYKLYIIFNDTDNTVEYEGGTIAPQVADIWLQSLDGSNPVFVGTCNAANSRADYSVGFVSFKSNLEEIYVDNLALSPGAFLSFPPPPFGTVIVIR